MAKPDPPPVGATLDDVLAQLKLLTAALEKAVEHLARIAGRH